MHKIPNCDSISYGVHDATLILYFQGLVSALAVTSIDLAQWRLEVMGIGRLEQQQGRRTWGQQVYQKCCYVATKNLPIYY